MATSTTNRHAPHVALGLRAKAQAGFTMIEMVVAMMVLMVGLLGLASAVAYALAVTNGGRNVTNTKLLIVAVLEQMENLRNTKELAYCQISNAGASDLATCQTDNDAPVFNGFETGFKPVSKVPGPDGLFGTPDDLKVPGPDGLYGTPDDTVDTTLARAGYEREVVITPLTTTLKKIVVTLKYPAGDGKTRTMKGISYLNDDAKNNFLR